MGNEVQMPTQQGIKTYLTNQFVKKKFEDILGSRAPSFISSIVSAVTMNPKLSACPPESIVSSAAIAASLDLPINPSLGMAHIVPYGKVAQFQMGWKGFIQLAMRSGKYQTMNISDIYEGDIKKINRFTGDIEFNDDQIETFESLPVAGYLFYFKLTTGFEKYFYMTKGECEAHGRKYSKSYDTGNWKKDFSGMARKTVVKMALSKFGILSIEMQKAIVTDQATISENGDVSNYPDNPANDISNLTDVTEVKKKTPKQQFNTLELLMTTSKKVVAMNEIIKGVAELSGLDKKEFTDAEYLQCVEQMNKELK